MSRLYSGEDLIAVVRARVPLNDVETEGATNADILNVINEEMLTTLCRDVMRIREEYYVITESVTLSANVYRYRINHRAMLQKVREIYYRNGSTRIQLPFIQREFRGGFDVNSTATQPGGYHFEGNHIVLLPDLSASYSGSLETAFFFRPGEIVLSTACRQVTAVNLSTGVVTLASAPPTTWTTSDTYDFHSQYSGSEIKCWSLTSSDITSNTMTFTAADINGTVAGRLAVEVGDWLCQAETAALPGLPRELHPILAQAATCRFLETLDPEKFQVCYQELQQSMERQYAVLGDRDESQSQIIPLANSPHLAGRIKATSFGSSAGL